MIEVPTKVWRPKVISRYRNPDFHEDDIDGILDYSQYGNCFYRHNLAWIDKSSRQYIIVFDHDFHQAELDKDLSIDNSIGTDVKTSITTIIKEYWDCFVKFGAARPILSYEFGIDTGGVKMVCFKKPSYGPYESKVIMIQVDQLLNNKWICQCGGPWGSMVVLAQKLHQEHINAIEDFVWHMCVSYHRLNAVTKPFQFLIPCCDDAITILECGVVTIYIISLDAR